MGIKQKFSGKTMGNIKVTEQRKVLSEWKDMKFKPLGVFKGGRKGCVGLPLREKRKGRGNRPIPMSFDY